MLRTKCGALNTLSERFNTGPYLQATSSSRLLKGFNYGWLGTHYVEQAGMKLTEFRNGVLVYSPGWIHQFPV